MEVARTRALKLIIFTNDIKLMSSVEMEVARTRALKHNDSSIVHDSVLVELEVAR